MHLLIAIHIAHWLSGGTTLTPLEPSEAMQFTQRGIVNAGVVFFALTIASTALLGRWFCGWACHVVALQDGTLWLLGKLGLRPRPLRSRLLQSVPLLAFLYMFISPLLYSGTYQHQLEYEFQTSEFWRTFPTWVPAILTFLTVGVLAVYLLGAKGFCTNGCPYGAAFALADRLSPYRIRVTDACTHCGHCTSVCSSNVRVHEEVKIFGKVIDPGCMKCLDCVSVCPNDALYYGRKPSVQRPPARQRAPLQVGWMVGQFVFGSVALFAMLSFDRAYQLHLSDMIVAVLLSLATCLLGWAAGTTSSGRKLNPLEEAVAALAFLIGLLALRGLFGAVAFLFALGLAATTAYAGVLVARLLQDRAVALHRHVLKRDGRVQGRGYLVLGILVLTCVGLVGAGQARWGEVRQQRAFDQAQRIKQRVTPQLGQLQRGQLAPQAFAGLAADLGALLELEPTVPDPLLGQALLRARQGDVPGARDVLRTGVQRFANDPRLWFNLALYEAETGDLVRGVNCLDQAVRLDPGNVAARRMRANMNLAQRSWDAAAEDLRYLLQTGGPNPELQRMLQLCENPPTP